MIVVQMLYLKIYCYNKEIYMNENKCKIYQIQLIENTNNCKILHVGNIKNTSDILIKKFSLKDNIFCNMVSCLYVENELNKNKEKGLFPLIRLDYYNKEDEKLLGNIVCEVRIKELNINAINKCELAINNYKNGKMICLEKIKKNPSNNKLIEKCLETLVNYFSSIGLL